MIGFHYTANKISKSFAVMGHFVVTVYCTVFVNSTLP